MLALSLGTAKTIAVIVVIVLIAGALAAAWIMKTIAQKAAIGAILALLALLVWTQRSSLDECADKVKAAGLRAESTCSFLGRDVTIKTSRSS